MKQTPFAHTVPRPFWLEEAPLVPPDASRLPAATDLLVVGSGYTGLSAAIEAARGGMSVLVLDRGPVGAGCSTRNGGQVSSSIKPELGKLAALHGESLARRIRDEGQAALSHAEDFILANGIDCDWRKTGRYIAAHSAKQFAGLERLADMRRDAGEPEVTLVPRSEQLQELGSDRYYGGAVSHSYAAVQPARLHAGLVRLAQELGVKVQGGREVRSIRRDGRGFEVQAGDQTVIARQVMIATNGYTGPLSPWLRRRIIPIGSYMLATDPLPAEVAARLIPKGRMVVDTRKVVIYFRLSPDGRRLIFGGRAALAETDPMRSLPRLYEMMLDVFPQLEGTAVSHAWNGFVAYTFDTLPHTGIQDGLHYAMGYCGSGVSLSLYYGMKAGKRILGRADGQTALDGLPFQTRPLYFGTPWFLGPSVAWYRFVDRYFS